MDRPRKTRRRIERPNDARYLTFSCYARRPLLGEADARDAVADQLMLARSRLGFRLLAWVLMPEHVHLLVVPPAGSEIPQVLMAIKRPVAAQVLARWRASDDPRLALAAMPDGSQRFWQAGGGYDRNIVDGDELPEKVRYIHENPVRRGFADRPEEWAWSSARAWERMESPWPDIDRI